MKRSAITIAGLVLLIAVAYLGYDLLKGMVSPCETIFEQTSVRLGTKLEILKTKGELHVGREKIQDLTEAAQVTALHLKTCCIVLDAGAVDSNQFLQCKNAAQSYEAKVDTVISTVEVASNAQEAGDTAAYQETVRQIKKVMEAARQASEALKKDVDIIVKRRKAAGTDGRETAGDQSAGAVGDQTMGELVFTWDGKTRAYWKIYQADSSGDYSKVSETKHLQKGQTQVVELAPGDYRVDMNWNRGFKAEDLTIEAGQNLSIRPVYGTVSFRWDGKTRGYWKIYQADSYGDYSKVSETKHLQKGQTQVVELAPGDYRVDMNWNRGFKAEDLTIEAGQNLSIRPVYGTVSFRWDGKTRGYWKIYQADSFGDYSKVSQTKYLQKGQTQVVELAPGDYRVDMNWNRGFKAEDLTIEAGQNLSIRPVYGTVSFRWDGKTKAYWNIYQADSFGDYSKVSQTKYLQKGQTQVVELAPGDYRVDMNWNRGFKAEDLTIEAGQNLSIRPVYGTVSFRWDGKTKAYWNIYQADSFGDYSKVSQTKYLQKGQTQVVELAPGGYWVQRNTKGAAKGKVIVEVGGDTLITQ